jgi:DNA replication protein DnaC
MNITENYILIKEFMHDGGRIKINNPLSQADIKESDIVKGGLITKNLPFECPICKGTYAFLCQDGDDWLAFCGENVCMKAQSIASKMKIKPQDQRETGAKRFSMGSTYHNADFPQWLTNPTNYKTVLEWTSNKSPFLITLGGVGTGKSYMCACILNYLYAQKKNVYYTNHRRFISDIQAPISEGKSSDEIVHRFMYQDILIFDDLGSGTNTDWQKEKILDVIDHRYSHNMKTVITSNFDRLALKDFVGARTVSRLFDNKNTILDMQGLDRRNQPEEAW